MPKYNKEKKSATNLKRTTRMSVRPCCFNNPRLTSPPYQTLSPPTDYQTAPPSTLNVSPPLSPITTLRISPSKLLLTLKSSLPLLTSPPSAPTQPFKHSLPLTINMDPIELIFSTPHTSPHTLFESLKDLPPRTTNPPPLSPSFESIKRLENQPSPLLAMEPPLPPLPPQLPPLPLQLPPLGPNNPFSMLTHEIFCDQCQRTQVIVNNLRDEMRPPECKASAGNKDPLSAKHQRATKDPLSAKHQRVTKDQLSAKHQRATSEKSTRFTLQDLKALISNPTLQDSKSNIKGDQRSSSEFLANLHAEFHERALLANQRRFYKRSGRVGSLKKPLDKINETCFAYGKPGHFQKECPLIKKSTPHYLSSRKLYNKPKFHTNITPQHNQHVNNNQKDYIVKYKGLKAEIAVLTKKIDAINKGKSEKGLVAESFNWDEESVSSDDKGVTKFKALMAVVDKLLVRRADGRYTDARSGQWVEITMNKVQKLLSITHSDERKHVLDYTHVDLYYVKDQRKNLLSKYNYFKQEFSLCKSELSDLKNTKTLNNSFQNEITKLSLENASLKDEIYNLKKVIEKWTSNKVTFDQLLTEQVLGNIVRAIGRKYMRKEQNSSKEVVFTKSDVLTSETYPKKPSNSESEGNSQKPIPTLPKLFETEPSGHKRTVLLPTTTQTTDKVVKGLKEKIQTRSETSPPTSELGCSRLKKDQEKDKIRSKLNKNGKHIEEGIKNTIIRLIILKQTDKVDIGESSLIRPELVQETTDKVVLIKEKLKVARDHQKSYAYNRRKPLEFEVGDQVLLKVSSWKDVVHFREKEMLAPRDVGPFEIIKGIYCTDANLHVHLEEIKVDKTLRFVEESVKIINREVMCCMLYDVALFFTYFVGKRFQLLCVGNQTNGNAGTKANIDAGQAGKKTVPGPQYVLLPLLTTDSQGQWFYGFEVEVVGCSREQWEWQETGGLGFSGDGGKNYTVYSILNVGGNRGIGLFNLQLWSLGLTRTGGVSPCGFICF
uniref:Putative reverse transcriptase domain-containing protein n=1 Tax=Tanacetum cinerariifolium TaxID=118510 RepID=A0A6L2LZW4_TANCI|nr:putative reverse transcriptase domain-containing protein [Tanacetum cinerariifolium]